MYNPYNNQYRQYSAPTLSGRVVTSREEAMGVPVDFTQGFTLMPDFAHGRIYAKVFNPNTGDAPLREFTLAEPVVEKPVQYATKEEVQSIREKLDELLKGGAV